mgnify:CR=1 FL=1
MDDSKIPSELQGAAVASAFKQLCHQAAMLTQYDRRLSYTERRFIEAAKQFLEITLNNDDFREQHELERKKAHEHVNRYLLNQPECSGG